MITLQIVDGSLQVSNNGSIILVAPKNSCAIDVLSLYDAIPLAVIYNKYLGTSTNIFTQPLANCQNSVGTPFTVNSFIAFAEANLGFDTVGGGCGGSSPFEYNANLTGIQPILGTNTASGIYSTIGGGQGNTASNTYATVNGGLNNCASGTCSFIGGGVGNIANANFGSLVSGGFFNTASDLASTIGGGYCNVASGNTSTVSGGYFNLSSGSYSFIGGGHSNTASGTHSFIGGGDCNIASGCKSIIGAGYKNCTSASYSNVNGGTCNITNSRFSIIGGGQRNIIQSPTNECCSLGVTIGGGIGHNTNGGVLDATTGNLTGVITCCNAGKLSTISGGLLNCGTGVYSTIGGGKCNTASGTCSFVGGGYCNIASSNKSIIGGGFKNCASGIYSTIAGGYCNNASGGTSFVGGGCLNTASNSKSSVGGGRENTASGYISTISGGKSNTASNCYSTIGGGVCNTASCVNATIGGGCCNIVNSDSSAILGGKSNNTNSCPCSMIVGNNITANRSCTTFVNDLSVSSMSACSGCSVKVSTNGLLITNNLSGAVHTFLNPAVGQSTNVSLNGTAISTIAGVVNKLTVSPFIPSQTITSASLYINVTITGIGSNARILIYSNLNGKPDTKIYESASLDCSVLGVKTATTVQTFVAGTTYWIGVQTSSTQTLSGISIASLTPIYSITNVMSTSLFITPAFGSAPTSFGSGTAQNLTVALVGITL